MTEETTIETKVTIEDLLDAGVHFGHQTKRWNPKMKRYIFGERNGIYIIDLVKSLGLLRVAQEFLYDTVIQGKSVLFVGTKKQAQEPLQDIANRLEQFYVTHRWLGGMLTNNTTIRNSVAHMRELEKMEEDGSLNGLASKKEASSLRREMTKLRRNLSGIADMDRLPGAIFIVDVCRESIAITEAKKLGIPVIAMVDTNADPDDIDYPIPANDDAIRAISLITKAVGDTILQASNEYARKAAELARQRAAEEAEAKARQRAEQEARRVRREAEQKARAEDARQKKAAQAEAKKAQEEAATVEAPAAEASAPEAPAAE